MYFAVNRMRSVLLSISLGKGIALYGHLGALPALTIEIPISEKILSGAAETTTGPAPRRLKGRSDGQTSIWICVRQGASVGGQSSLKFVCARGAAGGQSTLWICARPGAQ